MRKSTTVPWYAPRFSLLTMFVLITVLFVYLSAQKGLVNRRQQLLAKLEAACGKEFNPYTSVVIEGGTATYPKVIVGTPHVPWLRGLFGDKPVPQLALPPSLTETDASLIMEAFPEAWVTRYPAAPAPAL